MRMFRCVTDTETSPPGHGGHPTRVHQRKVSPSSLINGLLTMEHGSNRYAGVQPTLTKTFIAENGPESATKVLVNEQKGQLGSGAPSSAKMVSCSPAGPSRRALREFHGVRVGSAMSCAPASVRVVV